MTWTSDDHPHTASSPNSSSSPSAPASVSVSASRAASQDSPEIQRWQDCRGLLLDLDGVITPTLDIHKRAWFNLFAPYIEKRAAELHTPLAPYTMEDYFTYVDGRHRLDGVRDVLRSRNLPEADNPDIVEQLGLKKNAEFMETLERDGIQAYPGSAAVIDAAQHLGIPYAVVSSSRNTRPVLRAAHLLERFDVIVDGNTDEEKHLRGKPAPDTYLYAAELLGLPAADCAVFEDAAAGVAAGRAGGFGLVVGVNRGTGETELISAGADIVVDDLGDTLA